MRFVFFGPSAMNESTSFEKLQEISWWTFVCFSTSVPTMLILVDFLKILADYVKLRQPSWIPKSCGIVMSLFILCVLFESLGLRLVNRDVNIAKGEWLLWTCLAYVIIKAFGLVFLLKKDPQTHHPLFFQCQASLFFILLFGFILTGILLFNTNYCSVLFLIPTQLFNISLLAALSDIDTLNVSVPMGFYPVADSSSLLRRLTATVNK